MVIFHEIGHLVAAKKAGIGVEEFGIGLGPRLFSFKKGETLYGIHLFPIGGFVNLAGLDSEVDSEKIDPTKSFQFKSLAARFWTIFSGPLANLIIAVLIFFIVFSLFGVPADVKNEIESIFPGSPAQKVGLKKGDLILALNDKKIEKMKQAIATIHQWPAGKEITLTIQRDQEIFKVKVIPEYQKDKKISLIGFALAPVIKKYGLFSSLLLAFSQTFLVIASIFQTLFFLIIGRVGWQGLAGPLGIAQITGQVASRGGVALIQFTGYISINLAVINLMPLPALDGGRLLFLIIELFRGKAINQEREKLVHFIGFAFLMALLIFLTFTDLKRILSKETFFK